MQSLGGAGKGVEEIWRVNQCVNSLNFLKVFLTYIGIIILVNAKLFIGMCLRACKHLNVYGCQIP